MWVSTQVSTQVRTQVQRTQVRMWVLCGHHERVLILTGLQQRQQLIAVRLRHSGGCTWLGLGSG